MRHYFTKNAQHTTKSLTSKFCLKGSMMITGTIHTPLSAMKPTVRQFGVSQNQSLTENKPYEIYEISKTLTEIQKRQQFLGGWLGRKDSPKKEKAVDLDLSDIEFDDEDAGWGGITRPGAHPQQLGGEEFPKEQAMEDEWDQTDFEDDDDDDDHGGQMMPLPRLF